MQASEYRRAQNLRWHDTSGHSAGDQGKAATYVMAIAIDGNSWAALPAAQYGSYTGPVVIEDCGVSAFVLAAVVLSPVRLHG